MWKKNYQRLIQMVGSPLICPEKNCVTFVGFAISQGGKYAKGAKHILPPKGSNMASSLRWSLSIGIQLCPSEINLGDVSFVVELVQVF